MWGWIRYRAVILAVVPFIVAGSLWYLSRNAAGWDGVGFLLLFIVSIPVLTAVAAFSVWLAFRKGDSVRKLDRTSQIASVLSLTVFGGLVVIGAAGVIQSVWF